MHWWLEFSIEFQLSWNAGDCTEQVKEQNEKNESKKKQKFTEERTQRYNLNLLVVTMRINNQLYTVQSFVCVLCTDLLVISGVGVFFYSTYRSEFEQVPKREKIIKRRRKNRTQRNQCGKKHTHRKLGQCRAFGMKETGGVSSKENSREQRLPKR